MDIDSDEDTEVQLHDLNQLTAVLEADEPSTSESASQYSSSTATAPIHTSKNVQDLTKIDAALALNKLTDEKLRRIEKILESRLRECRQKIKKLQSTGTVNDKQESFRYLLCGKPYFKDKSNFPAPDNEDTILMAQSQMFDFSQVLSVSGWTVRDKSQFVSEIRKMSQDIRRNELQAKISQLRRDNKKKENKHIETIIAAINKEINEVNNKSLNELALPLHKEYDWDMLANRVTRRHTAQEYQALWKLFFHPSINKNSWTKTEHTALQKLASEHNLEDWDTIAKKLNTGRTGYQCFVYFRTNMTNTSDGRKWTKEEEEYLRRLIDYYQEDKYIPWGKVAAAMENRTKIQIYNKYLRLIENRKGRFLPEEDAVILNCVSKFGTNFRRMMNYLPGRSIVQIRSRYNVLTKVRVSAVWTEKEDRKLIQLVANQENVNYSSIASFFPGKDRVHIRSRYNILVKWMRKYPNMDIAYAPRRGARRLTHGQATENLNKAIEDLKQRMQSEVNSKRSRRITKDSPETDVEDAIVTTLYNELVQDEEEREAEEECEQQLVLGDNSVISREHLNITNLRKILIILNARLNKECFLESHFSEEYPSLAEEQEVCLVKVKSYSKKDRIKTIEVNKNPDIWGYKTLGQLKCVLPPHYATITGCRALMSFTNRKKIVSDNGINVNILLRRNLILREQYDLLMERFNALFVWPMLLSNEGPNLTEIHARNETKMVTSYHKPLEFSFDRMETQTCPEVTVPSVKESDAKKCNKRKNKVIQNTDSSEIDLLESNEKDNVTFKEDLSEIRLYD